MTEQEENQLICERLLGWRNHSFDEDSRKLWRNAEGERIWNNTPSFTDWSSVGLILEAMAKQAPTLVCYSANEWALVVPDNPGSTIMNTGPLAIRDAAMAYLRATEQAGDRNAEG